MVLKIGQLKFTVEKPRNRSQNFIKWINKFITPISTNTYSNLRQIQMAKKKKKKVLYNGTQGMW